MKIVINKCFGGFGVSKDVYEELGIEWDGYGDFDNKDFDIKSDNYEAYRAHPKLIAAIEKIGLVKASDSLAKLRIVDVPDDIDWYIDDYNGVESVHEHHKSW